MDTNQAVSILKSDGYIHLPGIFSLDFISKLKSETYNQLNIESDQHDLPTKRVLTSLSFKNVFLEENFFSNEKISSILKSILGPDFLIESFLIALTAPGSPMLHIHSDGGILYSEKKNFSLPAHAIGFLVPLTKMNEVSGTTRIWPKSNTGLPYRNKNQHEKPFTDLDLELGDIALLDTRTFHAGTPNQSDSLRPLLYVTFSTPWYINQIDFKEFSNFTLSDQDFNTISDSKKHMFVRRNIRLNV